MVIERRDPEPRLSGDEPAYAFGGAALLGASFTLPVLQAHGMSPVPPCLFHTVTGLPCPFCGGTRSFVAMAHGNLAAAVHVYPIGPLLFAGVVLALIYGVFALVTARRYRLVLEPRTRKGLLIVAGSVLAANWLAKLLFLGY